MYQYDEIIDYTYFIEFPLLIMSGLYLGIMGYALLTSAFKSNRLIHNIKTKEQKITIIRGVPGVGKDSYALREEENKNGTFAVICSDNYFVKDGEYKFNRKNISKSEAYSFEEFHLTLTIGVPRIYITNVNNKRWMYSNYIKLAESYGYEINVVELKCETTEELTYFNKRCTHNVPLGFSKNVLNNWEKDDMSEIIEPYIGDFNGPLPGDSLPSYPPKTKRELDIELDTVINTTIPAYNKIEEKCVIESLSDEDDVEFIDYFSFNVVELKDILKKRGLSTIGTKRILIRRIEKFSQEIDESDEEDADGDGVGDEEKNNSKIVECLSLENIPEILERHITITKVIIDNTKYYYFKRGIDIDLLKIKNQKSKYYTVADFLENK